MFKIKYFYFATLALTFTYTLVSCKKDETTVKAESSISYVLTMSPDLLKFVTPQVNYIDENGALITITGVEELDKKVIENKAVISEKSGGSEVFISGWTKQTVTGTGYKCWTFQMKFNRLNFHSYMGVRYLRNNFVDDSDNKTYDFHHNINTSIIVIKTTITEENSISGKNQSIDSKAYTDSHFSISNTIYHQGDNLDNYLDNLMKNPDKAGYFVDDEGNATRKDEFDI